MTATQTNPFTNLARHITLGEEAPIPVPQPTRTSVQRDLKDIFMLCPELLLEVQGKIAFEWAQLRGLRDKAFTRKATLAEAAPYLSGYLVHASVVGTARHHLAWHDVELEREYPNTVAAYRARYPKRLEPIDAAPESVEAKMKREARAFKRSEERFNAIGAETGYDKKLGRLKALYQPNIKRDALIDFDFEDFCTTHSI